MASFIELIILYGAKVLPFYANYAMISSMKSFIDVNKTFGGQPRELGPLLARVDTGKGREALYEDQLPALLHQLAEDARVSSITASNAIEGVVVESSRAEMLAEGSRRFR